MTSRLLRQPQRSFLTAILLKLQKIRIGVFFDCLLLSVCTFVNQNSSVFKSDQQPVMPAICCCSQATSLTPTGATINTSWSVTGRRKPDGRTPARVCFPRGWPLWSSAVSRRTPCCSGSLAGKLWRPGVKKNNSLLGPEIIPLPLTTFFQLLPEWNKGQTGGAQFSATTWS